MFFTRIYVGFIKNKINYNLIIFNKKKKMWFNININYFFIKNNFFYLKKIKYLFYQSGFQNFYFRNWYKFGPRYNWIKNLSIIKK
jgi:hypothetical protein